MDYELEELIPVLSRLTDKYTSMESTSITYEKANQLMGAILYCIEEWKLAGSNSSTEIDHTVKYGGLSERDLSAAQAYSLGLQLVIRKVKKALRDYNRMMPSFHAYGNACYYDTVVKALPGFFKLYDPEFQPQNTIITMDYPVLCPLHHECGIDAVSHYISAIAVEQRFLGLFPNEYVKKILENSNPDYRHLIENLAEDVLLNALGHQLIGKGMHEIDFSKNEYEVLKQVIEKEEVPELIEKLRNLMKQLLHRLMFSDVEPESYEEEPAIMELMDYLLLSIENIAVRFKNAASCDSLKSLL